MSYFSRAPCWPILTGLHFRGQPDTGPTSPGRAATRSQLSRAPGQKGEGRALRAVLGANCLQLTMSRNAMNGQCDLFTQHRINKDSNFIFTRTQKEAFHLICESESKTVSWRHHYIKMFMAKRCSLTFFPQPIYWISYLKFSSFMLHPYL